MTRLSERLREMDKDVRAKTLYARLRYLDDRLSEAEADLVLADRLALNVTWATRETDPAAWWDAVEQAVDMFISARRRTNRPEDGHVCRCMEVSEKLDPTTETHSAHPIPHVHDGDDFHELTQWEAANRSVDERISSGAKAKNTQSGNRE